MNDIGTFGVISMETYARQAIGHHPPNRTHITNTGIILAAMSELSDAQHEIAELEDLERARQTINRAKYILDMSCTDEALIQVGIDWAHLIVKAGGMARKSDRDAWLMAEFGVTEIHAHSVSNDIERQHRCYSQGGVWNERNAHRPEPTPEEYGGWARITLNGTLGGFAGGHWDLEEGRYVHD